jgi:hypothetical protein
VHAMHAESAAVPDTPSIQTSTHCSPLVSIERHWPALGKLASTRVPPIVLLTARLAHLAVRKQNMVPLQVPTAAGIGLAGSANHGQIGGRRGNRPARSSGCAMLHFLARKPHNEVTASHGTVGGATTTFAERRVLLALGWQLHALYLHVRTLIWHG